MEDDASLIFDDDSATLAWLGLGELYYIHMSSIHTSDPIHRSLENETEVSFFNRDTYETFKKNPDMKW